MPFVVDIVSLFKIAHSAFCFLSNIRHEDKRLASVTTQVEQLESLIGAFERLGDRAESLLMLKESLKRCGEALEKVEEFIEEYKGQSNFKKWLGQKDNDSKLDSVSRTLTSCLVFLGGISGYEILCLALPGKELYSFEKLTKSRFLDPSKWKYVEECCVGPKKEGSSCEIHYSKLDEETAVVVKKLKKLTPANVEAMKQEILLYHQLGLGAPHLPIVRMFGYYKMGENNYHIVFEQASNSLDEVIQDQKIHEKDESERWFYIWKWAYAIATALAEVHCMDIIHRDIRAANVLIFCDSGKDYNAKITDFGTCANPMDSEAPNTAWAAPEILTAADAVCTPTSDVFSYGSFLYEIASGNRPFFEEDNHDDIVRRIVGERMPELPESWPEKYREIISDCWKYSPNSRPSMVSIKSRCSVEYNLKREEKEKGKDIRQKHADVTAMEKYRVALRERPLNSLFCIDKNEALHLFYLEGNDWKKLEKIGTGWRFKHILPGRWSWDYDTQKNAQSLMNVNFNNHMDLYVWTGIESKDWKIGRKKGTGWIFSHYFVGPWTTQSGFDDIIARTTDGKLMLYVWSGEHWRTQTGLSLDGIWNYREYYPGKWTEGSFYDIITVDDQGDMFLHSFDGQTFQERTQIGTGWNYKKLIAAPWTHGKEIWDFMAIDADNCCYFCQWNGISWDKRPVGGGWNSNIIQYFPGNWLEGERISLVALHPSGNLSVFEWNGEWRKKEEIQDLQESHFQMYIHGSFKK